MNLINYLKEKKTITIFSEKGDQLKISSLMKLIETNKNYFDKS